MLVVVKHRNLHAVAQLALDVEAFRSLDVLQVDTAETGFQAGDDLDQFVGVVFADFDIEHVDAGEFLEQDTFSFHHRLGRQRTDIAQTEHGGAVGDDRYQVATSGDGGDLARIVHDRFASGGDTGGVGQRQIALVSERLGRGHFDLAVGSHAMVAQGAFVEIVSHVRTVPGKDGGISP